MARLALLARMLIKSRVLYLLGGCVGSVMDNDLECEIGGYVEFFTFTCKKLSGEI